MKRWWGLVWIALMAPSGASAFCGFYVSGADAEVFNNATMVVLMREGNHTVLSMQNDYRGPPEDFAMVVPVPTILREEDVRTLPREVFERVERLSAPRLVEYWEQDPCAPHAEGFTGLGNIGTGRGGGGIGYGLGAGGQVVVEAEFSVAEYDIVILSARDSSGLEAWLRDNDYRIPEGAAATLRPYVEAGTKFFVAKVDVERVRFEDGRAVLSPLRVHYTSDELSLPVRLGLLNSSGTQDLIVHVLARNQRYDLANRPNVTIPTNIDISADARARFGEFYAALFDRTIERNPGAAVTEYAWQATSCDPCPPDAELTETDIATLGGDVASREIVVGLPEVVFERPTVGRGLRADVVARVERRHINEIRYCYEQGLAQGSSAIAGTVEVEFDVAMNGAVSRVETVASTIASPRVEACIRQAVQRWTYPAPEPSGVVTVRQPIALRLERPAPGTTRRFGARSSDLVLTRLHLRYSADDLDSDLVFRAADPIVGGRETPGPDGRLEEGATPADFNNFQGRYVIRHRWEGAIGCSAPIRNVWGARPESGRHQPEITSATDLANAPRGELDLASFAPWGIPALGIERPAPEPIEEAVEEETPAPAAQTREGCGCSAVARGPTPVALLFALSVLRWRRRVSGSAGSRSRR
jgi:TonB family protein